MNSPDLFDRFRGCLLGLACGDAVGTTVEFKPRGSFKPVTDMVGGGPFSLQAGQWTDDTSMALCLARSLIERGGFDATDQMNRYVNWWHHGYLSSTGECFDIGTTTRQALAKYLNDKNPFAGSTDPRSAGNGSLMRLAPIAMAFHGNDESLLNYAADSSRTTHAALEAVESCRLFASMLSLAFAGASREDLLINHDLNSSAPAVRRLAGGDYKAKSVDAIKGSGYCIESLEAALWCFHRSSSFEEAVLAAVNLGDDADTTGAIVGQIAGAYYGASSIPKPWLERLAMRELIEEAARALHEMTMED